MQHKIYIENVQNQAFILLYLSRNVKLCHLKFVYTKCLEKTKGKTDWKRQKEKRKAGHVPTSTVQRQMNHVSCNNKISNQPVCLFECRNFFAPVELKTHLPAPGLNQLLNHVRIFDISTIQLQLESSRISEFYESSVTNNLGNKTTQVD